MPLVKRTDKGSPLSIAEMDANWDYATLGGYTYAEVAVSSADILAFGGFTPKTLLTTPAANQYYDISKVIIEFTEGNTTYTFGGTHLRLEYSDIGFFIDPILITGGYDAAIVLDFNSRASETFEVNGLKLPIYPNYSSLILDTVFGSSPTLGDGTMLVKIWYKVKTFGTEL